jgi:hypothetical protein
MSVEAMNELEFAAHLATIATRVERLGQTRQAPEFFHAEKSELAAMLRRAANSARSRRRRIPSTSWRPGYDV